MTTKEMIRAEIERRMKELDEQIVDIYDSKAVLRNDELQKLLSFLDTLPDEPVTDCHDLKEAKEEYVRKARRTPGHEWMTRDIEDAFIAGAEWQKAKMISALKNDGELPIEFIDKFHEIDRNAFQNGQKNMKEQMMEGAVEGVVWGQVGKNTNISVLRGVCKYLEQDDLPYKVRIIIVKEEEQ